MEVTNDELARQLKEMKTEFTTRHDQLLNQVSENRQIADTRHIDNVLRLDALEEDVKGVKADVQGVSQKLDANTQATNETKEAVDALVAFFRVGRAAVTVGGFLKRSVVGSAALLGSLALLWALFDWIRGRGPFPPIGH